MSAKLYYNPFVPAFSNIGVPIAEARLYFYYTATTTLAPVYSNSSLTTPLTNPVQANLAGKYPDIYLDSNIIYKVKQTDKNDAPIGDAVDPYVPGSAVGTPGGNVLAAGLFTDLATLAVPVGTNLIQTSGYSVIGAGSALYAKDSLATLALATAHPKACKADAAGRYWRLLPNKGEVHVLSLGAKAVAGQNDQPVIQAAVQYAAALGQTSVRFAPFHESWQPVFPGGTPEPRAGSHILCTGNVPLLGAEGGTVLDLKNSTGGLRLKTDGTSTWWSGWLVYFGTSITKSVIYGIEVKGNTVFSNYLSNAESNQWDKGIQMEGQPGNAPNMAIVDHRNLTMRNFAGEIWYRGGYAAGGKVYAQNVTVEYSPQSAWNPASLDDVWAENLVAGYSYQSTESICAGQTYVGGRFHNSTSCSFVFTESFNSSYAYSYPFLTASKPYWLTFIGTKFETTGRIYLTCRARGTMTLVDSFLSFLNYGKMTDINLKVEAWVDQTNNETAVDFSGIPSLTTQVAGAPGGIYYQIPANIKVDLDLKITAAAKASGYRWGVAVRQRGGLADQNSIGFTVKGEVLVYGGVVGEIYPYTAPIAGSQFVLVEWSGDNNTIGNYVAYPNADFSIQTQLTHLGLQPQAVGTFTMTMTNASNWTFAHGQRMRIIQYTPGGGTGRVIKLPASGNGYSLKQDRYLYEVSDYIDLTWDSVKARWVEKEYVTAKKLRLTGSKTYDAPALRGTLVGSKTYDAPSVAASGTTTTTVTVTGAALGDRAVASFGLSTAGLDISASVTAADTVTVVIDNPTAGAIDLASTTLTATVGGPTTTSTTVTVTGAALGDYVDSISLGVDTQGVIATGSVTAADTVTVYFTLINGVVDLASTTLSVEVKKKEG